jgi:DNA-binding MarR family transcriptional regulator
MTMREAIRSGRRENFYATDNAFIDHYAREMRLADIAVYHALERYMNYNTRSTWVGTAKIAEVLNVSQRTVQRSLKVLEDFKVIRIVRNPTMTVYYVVPLPPRGKTSAATPLFDAIDEKDLSFDDTLVARATSTSHSATFTSHTATTQSRRSDTDDVLYKEERDFLNKNNQQELLNEISAKENYDVTEPARRILSILGLPESSLSDASAAVVARKTQTSLSIDGIVQDIVTAANHAARRGVEKDKFLEQFLVETSARRIVRDLDLPATNSLVSTVAASVKAEMAYTQLPAERVAAQITSSAIEDRQKGTAIDRFYFEGVKWRSNVKINKAEQRKLDNLEVNARVKQRFRERLGVSRLD